MVGAERGLLHLTCCNPKVFHSNPKAFHTGEGWYTYIRNWNIVMGVERGVALDVLQSKGFPHRARLVHVYPARTETSECVLQRKNSGKEQSMTGIDRGIALDVLQSKGFPQRGKLVPVYPARNETNECFHQSKHSEKTVYDC
ncbi:unnamed protein product [Laminaria digitata]